MRVMRGSKGGCVGRGWRVGRVGDRYFARPICVGPSVLVELRGVFYPMAPPWAGISRAFSPFFIRSMSKWNGRIGGQRSDSYRSAQYHSYIYRTFSPLRDQPYVVPWRSYGLVSNGLTALFRVRGHFGKERSEKGRRPDTYQPSPQVADEIAMDKRRAEGPAHPRSKYQRDRSTAPSRIPCKLAMRSSTRWCCST